MQNKKNMLYQKIKDIKTKEQFEKEIKKIQEEYDNLFDENTAALLILDELGRNLENQYKINNLQPGIECTITGEITKINQTHNFNRKNGTNGRVTNLEITDSTGTCTLVLWNKDVGLVENKTIKKGTHVKIINGYVKKGYNGIEINAGRWGLIETSIENTTKTIKKAETEGKIKGTLIEKMPTKPFFKDNGEFGFVTTIKLKTKEKIKEITIWDQKVKEIQKFKEGDIIEIKNMDLREKNGKTEMHLNGRSMIKKI